MKSILLHIYEDSGLDGRIRAAIDAARRFDGHITCLHATPIEDYLAVDPLIAAALPEEFSGKMEKLRIELQERVEDRLRRETVGWDWVHRNELISHALIRYSILADIVVVTLAGRALERHDPRPLAAAVATGSRAPVLAVPEAVDTLHVDSPVVIAWNGSPEAAAAVRAALPFLRIAPQVHLLEVEDRLSRYPRDLAARYLSRHGVHVEIVQRRPIEESVTRAIVEFAREAGAGLIVMGAYGHSRLRELLLGGVTRDLIGSSPIPLLLAH
jgi:nucleotide-binding universal stress UspA family protein